MAQAARLEDRKPFYLPYVAYNMQLALLEPQALEKDTVYIYWSEETKELCYKVKSQQDGEADSIGTLDNTILNSTELANIKELWDDLKFIEQTDNAVTWLDAFVNPILERQTSVRDKIAAIEKTKKPQTANLNIPDTLKKRILEHTSLANHTPFILNSPFIKPTGANSHEYSFTVEYIAAYRAKLFECSGLLGIPVAHLEEILQTAVANNAILGMRPTNLASRELVEKENAVGKPMSAKPKSSEGENSSPHFDPTSGYVPYDQSLSKLGQEADPVKKAADITFFQYKAEHAIGELAGSAQSILIAKTQLTRHIGEQVTTWFYKTNAQGTTDFVCTIEGESHDKYYFADKKTLALSEYNGSKDNFKPLEVIGEQKENEPDTFRPYTADCDLFVAEININGYDGANNQTLETTPLSGVMRDLGSINEYQTSLVTALSVATSDNVRHGADTGNPVSFLSELEKDLDKGIIMISADGVIELFHASSQRIEELQRQMNQFQADINQRNFEITKNAGVYTAEELQTKQKMIPPKQLELERLKKNLTREKTTQARPLAEKELIQYFNKNRDKGFNMTPNVRWGWEFDEKAKTFSQPKPLSSRVDYKKVFDEIGKGFSAPDYTNFAEITQARGMNPEKRNKLLGMMPVNTNRKIYELTIAIAEHKCREAVLGGYHPAAIQDPKIFAPERYDEHGKLDINDKDYHMPYVHSQNFEAAVTLLENLQKQSPQSPLVIEQERAQQAKEPPVSPQKPRDFAAWIATKSKGTESPTPIPRNLATQKTNALTA